MKFSAAILVASLASLASADYRFKAWSKWCSGKGLYETSGNVFDSYCHDVRGQGWISISGSAMAIKKQAVQFYHSGDCSGSGINVDDTSTCGILPSPNFEGEIGSWRASIV